MAFHDFCDKRHLFLHQMEDLLIQASISPLVIARLLLNRPIPRTLALYILQVIGSWAGESLSLETVAIATEEDTP